MAVLENTTVTQEHILSARENIRKIVRNTDLLPVSSAIIPNASEIWLKAESLQRTGSFKIRGAYNKILSLTSEEKRRGVIASSAGNHAQGVSLAAKLLGVRATIVMPAAAPKSKIEATRSYGGEIVFADGSYDDAYIKARELEHELKLTFVHPFDDPLIIAGQGTIALEISDIMPDCDLIAVPVGGGGLASGIAFAAKMRNPKIRVIGIEPENAASMYASLRAGKILETDINATIADGVAIKRPGELTYTICKKYLDDLVLVNEREIADTMLKMLGRLKVVSEGSGAVALTALLHDKIKFRYKKAAAILSGGNIDVKSLEQLIENAENN